MTKRQDRDAIYVKRQFDTEIIVLCVRWYITYRLSYRDLVAMMAERGVIISHTTIMRWVIRYVPEFEKRWNRFARSIGSFWRVDETYISIKGQWHYLYRALDKQGRSIDFILRPDRGIAAAQAFFRKAFASHPDRLARKVTLDGHVPSHRALRLLRRIALVHRDSRGTYGSPRVHRVLRANGQWVGEKRVARIMRAHGIKARVASQVWVGDITYLIPSALPTRLRPKHEPSRQGYRQCFRGVVLPFNESRGVPRQPLRPGRAGGRHSPQLPAFLQPR